MDTRGDPGPARVIPSIAEVNPDGSGVAFVCGANAYFVDAVVDEDHPFAFETCCVCNDGFEVSTGAWGGCIASSRRLDLVAESSRRLQFDPTPGTHAISTGWKA